VRTLAIWGCGGHGRVVFDIAAEMRAFDDIVFYDDNLNSPPALGGVRVLVGGIAALQAAGAEFVIAIGANQTRAARFAEAVEAGLRPAICIHPSAWISPSAAIGAGSVLLPRTVVQAGARVGVDCIVNTGAIVEHDCVIGDHAHLSPGVILGGGVRVGEYAHLGIGSVAIPGAGIGRGAIVGAGGVVVSEIEPNVTVLGIPARPRKKHEPE